MEKHSHSPRAWKYRAAAELPTTRARVINATRFDGPDGCWLWTGAVNEGGYAKLPVRLSGIARSVLVHRLALHLAGKPVDEMLVVDHTCHTVECDEGEQCHHRRCVNPAHLVATDFRTNVMRGNGYCAKSARAKQRKTASGMG